MVRYLGGRVAVAGVAQGIAIARLGLILWLIWRSELRYALKAATLSAAPLVATPHAFAYDLAAIAVPIAFLASDQMRFGLLRGEQMILLALFGTVLTVFVIFADRPVGTTFGAVPLGLVAAVTLLGVALRRAFSCGEQSSAS